MNEEDLKNASKQVTEYYQEKVGSKDGHNFGHSLGTEQKIKKIDSAYVQ